MEDNPGDIRSSKLPWQLKLDISGTNICFDDKNQIHHAQMEVAYYRRP